MSVRILLADDHTLVRAGIRALLDATDGVSVVAESGDGREALELIVKHRPDVALLDIAMPGMSGLEVARRCAQESPRTKVIILSMHADATHVRQAMRAGVAGYLVKGAAVTELPVAIHSVMRGETYLTPQVSKTVVDGFLREDAGEAGPLEGLTDRQREILQLVAEGQSTKEIARTLDLSVKTVETHRARIMERLGIRDLPGLVRFAIRSGLVSPNE
jgi:NarL family two-component system response regulator LiaR